MEPRLIEWTVFGLMSSEECCDARARDALSDCERIRLGGREEKDVRDDVVEKQVGVREKKGQEKKERQRPVAL
jgi:hypothetical protein